MFYKSYKNLIHSIRNTEFILFGFVFVVFFFHSMVFYFLSRERNLLLKEWAVPDNIEYVVEEGGRYVTDRLSFNFNGINYSASCASEETENVSINAPCNKNFYNKTLIGRNVKIFETATYSKRDVRGILISGDFIEKDKYVIYRFIKNEDFFITRLKKDKFNVYFGKVIFIIFLTAAFISLICLLISAKYNLFPHDED
ncbi:Uncharacterised protein [Kingella potus]|uniref:Uncharacterized protein n=1 Tax=Kingella potus TaxID=265175 RepID=A0A377QZH3_9NEIS|nr:hypothetical protein [Kingella potus]UOP01119.1 hypothetical protein LVJ84_01925 [Kingella potus]STR00814.1 Uncharacterised protein [Kingella potus]